jgi:hypothetical protein
MAVSLEDRPGAQGWDELNFLRLINLRRHLLNRAFNFTFERSVLRDLMIRLLDDPISPNACCAAVRAQLARYSSHPG